MNQTTELSAIREDLLGQITKLEDMEGKSFLLGHRTFARKVNWLVNEFTAWLVKTAGDEYLSVDRLGDLSVLYKVGRQIMCPKEFFDTNTEFGVVKKSDIEKKGVDKIL